MGAPGDSSQNAAERWGLRVVVEGRRMNHWGMKRGQKEENQEKRGEKQKEREEGKERGREGNREGAKLGKKKRGPREEWKRSQEGEGERKREGKNAEDGGPALSRASGASRCLQLQVPGSSETHHILGWKAQKDEWPRET